jgi:hypothetical protein
MRGEKAMSKRIVLMFVLLTTVVSFACMPAGADNVTIDTSGATPFLYEGHSYLPLRSVGSFLGAPLRWDAEKCQAVITYNGEDLALTPGNTNALFKGHSVVLPSPPVVVHGRTYVPTEALKKYYNIPVEWDGNKSEVKIKGPNGWGTTKVKNRPPWHGGPPPWAPAWGERRKQGVSNPLSPGNQGQHKGELKHEGKAKGQVKGDQCPSNLMGWRSGHFALSIVKKQDIG